MAPKLYLALGSPPVTSVLITAAAIGLELETHELDFSKKEQLSPEFVKLNPQHTVPTLVDGDYVLWDSHAINPYLVDKYAKDDSLYPKDIQKRATVDNRLHYNNATFINTLRKVAGPILSGESQLTEEGLKTIEELYTLLNIFLEHSKFIAGDNVTIADFSIIVNLVGSEMLVPVDEARFSKLVDWAKRVKELPCYSAALPSLKKFEEVFLPKLKK